MKLAHASGKCERLSTINIARLVKSWNIDPSDLNRGITPGKAMLLWFADVLAVLPLTWDQQLIVYDEFKSSAEHFGDLIAERIDANQAEIPVAYLGLGDRRYAAFTGLDVLLDVNTGISLEGNKRQFLETIQYNLTTLFIKRYQGNKDEQPGQAAG